MTKDNKQLYLDITMVMRKIGIPVHLKGHDYVRGAIAKVYIDKSYLDNLVDRLYTELAEEYGTSRFAIERGIRSVIESAWLHGNYNAINSIFGYTVDCVKAKPTNKAFIATIVDVLRLNNL